MKIGKAANCYGTVRRIKWDDNEVVGYVGKLEDIYESFGRKSVWLLLNPMEWVFVEPMDSWPVQYRATRTAVTKEEIIDYIRFDRPTLVFGDGIDKR